MDEGQIPLHLPNGDTAYVPESWGADQVKAFIAKTQSHPAYQAAPGVDKYHAAAQKALADQAAHGGDSYLPQIFDDLKRKYTQGSSLGWLDEATALAQAGIRSFGSPTEDFAESYKYTKALQDEKLAQATKNSGKVGTAAEILGGLHTGLAAGTNGATLVREGQTLIPRIAGSAAEGAGYGAVSGAGNAKEGERVSGAGYGAAGGAALGAGIPAIVSLAGNTLGGVVSQGLSRWDPEGAVTRRLGQIIARGRQTPQELFDSVRNAHAEGQPGFTLADALGTDAQNAIDAYGRAPGAARNSVVRQVNDRQTDQGSRIAGFAGDAFAAPGTGTQYERSVRETMRPIDDINYPRAAEQAGPVDMRATLNAIDAIRYPEGANPQVGLPGGFFPGRASQAPAPVEQAADIISRAGNSTSSGLPFNSVLSAKQQVNDILLKLDPRSNEYRQVAQIFGQLDNALEASTGGPGGAYRAANDTHAMFAQGIDAMNQGRAAYPKSAQGPDVAEAFSSLPLFAQQGARQGFKDAIVEGLPANPNANGANMLTSPRMQEKIDIHAISPEQAALFSRRLERENTMSGTRNSVVSGSRTADIQAAQGDGGIDPGVAASVVGDVTNGRFGNLAMNTLTGLKNWANGNTEPVRNGVLQTLFAEHPPVDLQPRLTAAADSARRWSAAGANSARGAAQAGGEESGRNAAAPAPIQLPLITLMGR